MQYEIDADVDRIDWNQVSDIIESIGWGRRQPSQLERAFRASKVVRFVRIDGSLIGFGRAVSDGEYYASIYDVIVKPDMQGVGVGTAIMKSLLEPLQGFLFTHLTSTPGNEGFYGRLGFRKQKTAMTIMRGANSTSAQAYIHEKDL